MSVSCIEMKAITKFFPSNAVRALEGADFCLKSGEIHALIGENGAGKSTLMRILAGHLHPDSGEILVDGLERSFFSPADALAAGIGMVSQKPELSPSLSVWEDCSLGIEQGGLREKIARAPLSALYRTVWRGLSLFAPYRKKARERVKDCAEREGINLDPDAHCDFLSAAERQMAGVLALLLRQTRFLIFDEPTAVLSATDSRKLFALWERLASQGRGIVVISHKLNEVRSFADRITVLRKGKRAASFDASSCSDEQLVSVMFGGKADLAPAESRGSAGHRGGSVRNEQDKRLYAGKPAGKAILNVTGLSIRDKTHPFLRNICFTVEAGEILGVLGIKESGIETLELGLAGFLNHFSGRIELDGVDISGGGPRSFRAAGGVYLSAGKRSLAGGKAIVSFDPQLSIQDNLLIHIYAEKKRNGHTGTKQGMKQESHKLNAEHIARRMINDAALSVSPSTRAGTLSGGTLQRLLVTRECAGDPCLIMMVEPAWGLDRLNRGRFFRFLRDKADEGRGILLFFSDIDEALEISDRILIVHNGECTEHFRVNERDRLKDAECLKDKIKTAMAGSSRPSVASKAVI